ncbi:hypothetical protein ACXYTJ_11335 [Gilvimarinus sp. F26214L]|uniref:hypothetical protein n=1 Tax=Gilvimarinus sp. DZF01 TaxID=3461371 RepID=UPI004046258F
MTDNKDSARKKILGELESIKDLLHEEHLGEVEPPLLTTPVDDEPTGTDEPPILSRRAAEPVKTPSQKEARPREAEDDIPILQVEVDPQEWMDPSESGPADREPAPAPDPESQPGLFDKPRREPAKPPADHGDSVTAQEPGAEPPPVRKTENPFLPKHIRDRINANRAAQQNMLNSLSTAPAKPPRQDAESRSPAESKSEDDLVEEVLKRCLPRIEAELREQIRAIIREQRED